MKQLHNRVFRMPFPKSTARTLCALGTACILSASLVRGATIRYALTNWNLSPPTNVLRISAVSISPVDGSSISPKLSLRLTPKNGGATNSLPAGSYRLEIQGTKPIKRFFFEVPNSTNSFSIQSLIISSNAVPATNFISTPAIPAAPEIQKRVLYVNSLTGSDEEGDGTLENPFRTVGYWAEDNPLEAIYDIAGQQIFFPTGALAQARGGDTIYLLPGNHTNIFIALWKTNDPSGVNLVGSGSDNTFFYVDSSLYDDILVGEPLQPGNDSIIRDFSVVNSRGTNGGPTWNGILGDAGGPSLYSHIGDYFAPDSMTNVTVMNIKGNGFYDGVYFSGLYCPYSARFINCEFSSIWDVFVCSNISNYTAARTESYNCTFHTDRQPGNLSPLHAAVLFGGSHDFFNCTFSIQETNSSGTAFGLHGQDGNPYVGFHTNQVGLYNCRFEDLSSTGSSLDITNFSTAAGRSSVTVFGGKCNPARTSGVSGLFGNSTIMNLAAATIANASTNQAPFAPGLDVALVPAEGALRTNINRRAMVTLGFTADFPTINSDLATISIHTFHPGGPTNVFSRSVADPSHHLSLEDMIIFRLSPGDVWYYTSEPPKSFLTKQAPVGSAFLYE